MWSLKMSIHMALGSRVKEVREQKGYSQATLADKAGLSQTAIHLLEKRDSQSSKFLIELASALDVNAEWLKTGNPLLKNIHNDNDKVNEEAARYVFNRLIPIIGRAQLGDGGFWEAMDYPTGHGDGYIQWYSDDPHAYAVQGVGESMSPRIKHNEFVIVEPNRPVMNGDEVFLATHDGRRMIKIFLYARDNRVHLESTNNDFEKIIVEAKDVQTMHYVAGIAKAKAKI